MRARIVALLVLLLAGAAQAARHRAVSPPSEANTTAEAWLKAHAVPFATAEPRADTSDLLPFGAMVGSARVVSLGEATHGSHEFFSMKRRLVEYLVREKGFTVFAMEAVAVESDLINDYVQGGAGDPRALLTSLQTYVWRTQELLDLIEWMRAYNASRGERPAVVFAGFDSQLTKEAAARLTAYLQRVDPAHAAATMSSYDCYRPYELFWPQYTSLASATKDQCRANIGHLYDAIAARHDADAEYPRALHDARMIVQAEDMNAMREEFDARDRYMAENVEWLANAAHPGARLVLWAHNGHVAAGDDYLMGAFLRKTFGAQMLIAGFAFGGGDFWSSDTGIKKFTVASPNDGWEAYFRTAALPRYYVDLRSAAAPAARALFDGAPKRMWEVGAFYTPENPLPFRPELVLSKNYDVVIWFDHVEASTLLPVVSASSSKSRRTHDR